MSSISKILVKKSIYFHFIFKNITFLIYFFTSILLILHDTQKVSHIKDW